MSIEFLPDGTAKVTQKSPISGTVNTVTMTMTFAQYERWAREGELIQRALPHLSPDEREFLMTGITAAEWDETFKEND